MSTRRLVVLLFASALFAVQSQAQYFPPAGQKWKKKKPAKAGFDVLKLQEALDFAKQSESTWNFAKDQERTFGKPLGPLPAERAATNMVILRDGYIVAEFGETGRADPVYSAAKSFLSMVCGLAVDQRRIGSTADPVGKTIRDGGYDSPRNQGVTWHHHLQQTSEWEGTMWDKKHDFLGREEFGAGERKPRELEAPGSHYEYNDVRVNRLSLSLLRLFEEPLPGVLRRSIMNPIGASNTWTWHGYANSKIELNGKQMTSVPGGTRWGGGLWMNSRDLARVGLLVLRKGQWSGKRILSEEWLNASLTAGSVGPDYGYLWWLNTKGKQWPSTPKTSFAAVGNGSNIIWVDPEHQIVVVWRWYRTRTLDEFLGKLLAAVQK